MTYLTILFCSLLSIPFLVLSIVCKSVIALADGLITTCTYTLGIIILVVIGFGILSLLGFALGMFLDYGLGSAVVFILAVILIGIIVALGGAIWAFLLSVIAVPSIFVLSIVKGIVDKVGNTSTNVYHGLINRMMRRAQGV